MKIMRLSKLTAATTLAVALPWGAANAEGPVCYKPVKPEILHKNLLDSERKLVATYGGTTQLDLVDRETMLHPRLVYVNQHGTDLGTARARARFGHGRQDVWDANGKVTNFPRKYAMEGFTGSAIRTKWAKNGAPNGARLTGEISAIQLGNVISVPVELDCTTAEKTVTPKRWSCTATVAVYGFPVVLEQVKIDEDENCSIFQDGRVRIDTP